MRLNTPDGRLAVIPTTPESWTLHPEGDDIAVAPIDAGEGKLKWFSVGIQDFISRQILEDYRLGPGDDSFLIGRLFNAAGRQKNTPVVRFGNLSMMADATEPVTMEGGQEQEAFLVECRSISGFSGSAVFIHTTQTYKGENVPKARRPPPTQSGLRSTIVSMHGTFGPWLLGIDHGHMPLWRPVYRADQKTRTENRVEANTGIACVIPAWRVLDVLNDEDLRRARKRDDAEITGQNRNAAIPNNPTP